MQKGSAIIWIVVAAVVVIGGGAAAYVTTDGFSFNNTAKQQAEETAQTQEQQESQDSPSLLRSALAGNATITCDYTSGDGTGTAHLKENRDFSITHNGSDGKHRLIKLDDTVYLWRTDREQGFKVNSSGFEDEMKQGFAVFNPETFERESENNSVDCRRSSSFDQDLFTVPDDIEFVSPGDQIPQNG